MPEFKTRISKIESVNNNAGQCLNLRDVYKVMEMRTVPHKVGHLVTLYRPQKKTRPNNTAGTLRTNVILRSEPVQERYVGGGTQERKR